MGLWPSSKKKDELSSFIKSALGFKPKNIGLYKTALTHSSVSRSKWENNERLEFLGDSVLDIVMAEWLFEKFPKKTEGELTRIKSALVSRDNLNKVGKSLGLKSFIKKSSNLEKNKYLEGNAFEAVAGAMFIDLGYKKARKILCELLINGVDLKSLERAEIDFKSRLYQWCQKNKVSLEVRFSKEEEENNVVSYTAFYFIENTLIGQGVGTSKKLAEKNASQHVFSTNSLSKVIVKNT